MALRFLNVASLVTLSALLVACGPENQAPATQENLPAENDTATPSSTATVLTPDGWGPLRIGMTREEVVAALGEDANPQAVGGPEPDFCDQFRPVRAPEAMLLMIEDGRLTRISLIVPSDVVTDGGLGIGATAAQVKAAYGDRAVVEPHKYQDAPAEYVTVWSQGGAGDGAYVTDPQARGLVYEIGSQGTVEDIHAGGPSIQYVEGCA